MRFKGKKRKKNPKICLLSRSKRQKNFHFATIIAVTKKIKNKITGNMPEWLLPHCIHPCHSEVPQAAGHDPHQVLHPTHIGHLIQCAFGRNYSTVDMIPHYSSHIWPSPIYTIKTLMLENCSLISVQHLKLPLTLTDETKAFGLCTTLQLDPRLPD